MSKVKLTLATNEEIDSLIEGTFRVMAEVGVDVLQEDAVALLKDAGCEVDGMRVKIPRELVKKCIDLAPNVANIYDRDGNLAMKLGDRNVYFGPGPTCPNFNDPRTGERRPAKKQDAADTALVADYLPNMDFVMSLCMIADQTESLADVHEVDAMLRNTSKPLCTWSFDADNVQSIIDMLAAVRGGYEQLAEKPLAIVYCEPTTPLVHTKEPVEILMRCAKYGVPVVYTPGMIVGATAPATLPAAMTVGCAETLTGVVIAQLVNPGTPMICAGTAGFMNMKSMNHTYGCAEFSLHNGISCEVMHRLGLPAWNAAGVTDSKAIDGQAAIEAVFQVFMAIGAGGNLVHDVGFSDLGMTGSIEHMIICDDIIRMAKRIFRGMDFSDPEEAFAFDVIKSVGPGGNFLLEDHTMDHYGEFCYPELIDSDNYGKWQENGALTITDRAIRKMHSILESHTPKPLDSELASQLDVIVAKAEQRVAKNNEVSAA